jgi:hypothetical protein
MLPTIQLRFRSDTEDKPVFTAMYVLKCMARDSSVGIATRYVLEGSGIECRWKGEMFRIYPDLPLCPPSLLYNGHLVFPGGKGGPGVTLTTHPLLVPRSWKSRAIPLLNLWARVACYMVKPYLPLPYVLKCHDRTNYSPIITCLLLLKMCSYILIKYFRGVKFVLYFNVCALTNEIFFVFRSDRE